MDIEKIIEDKNIQRNSLIAGIFNIVSQFIWFSSGIIAIVLIILHLLNGINHIGWYVALCVLCPTTVTIPLWRLYRHYEKKILADMFSIEFEDSSKCKSKWQQRLDEMKAKQEARLTEKK